MNIRMIALVPVFLFLAACTIQTEPQYGSGSASGSGSGGSDPTTATSTTGSGSWRTTLSSLTDPEADPSYCADFLVANEDPTRILGPESADSVTKLDNLMSCTCGEYSACLAWCGGSICSGLPINGSAHSAECKACMISACPVTWGLCLDDHDPADLCWGQAVIPASQPCTTAQDCTGYTAPVCVLGCDPATGAPGGGCAEYEE